MPRSRRPPPNIVLTIHGLCRRLPCLLAVKRCCFDRETTKIALIEEPPLPQGAPPIPSMIPCASRDHALPGAALVPVQAQTTRRWPGIRRSSRSATASLPPPSRRPRQQPKLRQHGELRTLVLQLQLQQVQWWGRRGQRGPRGRRRSWHCRQSHRRACKQGAGVP